MVTQLNSPSEKLRQELAAVRASREAAAKKRFTRSRLDRHRAEIEQLVDAGASWRDIAEWLRQYRHCKVHSTTVGRRLQQWQAEPSRATEAAPLVNSPSLDHTPFTTD